MNIRLNQNSVIIRYFGDGTSIANNVLCSNKFLGRVIIFPCLRSLNEFYEEMISASFGRGESFRIRWIQLRWVGPDRIIWGTDSAGFGIQIGAAVMGLREFQIPLDIQEDYGYPEITPKIDVKCSAGIWLACWESMLPSEGSKLSKKCN